MVSPNPFFKASIWVISALLLLLAGCSGEGRSAEDTAHSSLTCDEITGMHFTSVTLNHVELVEANEIAPRHCLVRGIIDSEIQFELRLPEDWNGKFLMVGGSGFVGTLPGFQEPEVAPALSRGYATTGTDTGHVGTVTGASWAYENFERQINFGYKAVHLTAQTSKEITRRYYGRDIDYSYFQGCSRGGGQAMMEAQRYPTDFDGLIGGAPAYDWTRFSAGMAWNNQQLFDSDSDTVPLISNEEYAQVQQAVLQQCDLLDGVGDGVLTDPRMCHFDAGTALPNFSAQQIAALDAIWAGPSNSNGQIFPGFPIGLNSQAWNGWVGAARNAQKAFSSGVFKYFVYSDPNYDIHDFDFENMQDMQHAAKLLNANDPDLSLFKNNQGKFLMWVGWSDAAISPLSTLAYHTAVVDRMGGTENVDDFFRLYMLPGVNHCGGGEGPDQVDWLSALEDWVEHGIAPERLIAAKLNDEGGQEMARPLCPHPQIAVYDGQGDPLDANSFTCDVVDTE